ncbi:hypothetical protein BDP81DRAFT_432141, partial [Colletotrichum phormii]
MLASSNSLQRPSNLLFFILFGMPVSSSLFPFETLRDSWPLIRSHLCKVGDVVRHLFSDLILETAKFEIFSIHEADMDLFFSFYYLQTSQSLKLFF